MSEKVGFLIGFIGFNVVYGVLWLLRFPPLFNAYSFKVQCRGWGSPFAALCYREPYPWEPGGKAALGQGEGDG